MSPRFSWLIALLMMLPTSTPLAAQDWAGFRGSDGLGTANPGGLLARAQNVDLKLRWKKELGSGYSSPVVVGDRVLTMYTDGENDFVICLDRDTGETMWQTAIGPWFKGENGSFDGPIATPCVADGHVYALDPGGKLACLAMTNGEEVWSVHLQDDLGSKKPLYGFATSPIAVDETLIVQTGVEEKSLAGFDMETGELKWTATNDSINSQTPVAVELFGRQVVLACGGKKLWGVDPGSGKVLFEFEHLGGNGSSVVPVPISEDRVVLTLDDRFSKAVTLRPGNDDLIEASEAWQNRSIKNTYNVPALTGNNLFAYSTRILTCVDPETGQPRWKSREPGDGFLITVDNHVIINTKQGSLHVAKADADQYEEVASLDLFDDRCWSLPAYSDNAIYCRNLKEIARVDIVAAETAMGAVGSTEMPTSTGFASFLDQLNKTDDATTQQELVNQFMEKHSEYPIVDGNVVHFVFRSTEAKDVAVASDLFGARQEKKMIRAGDTDLFYFATELESDQRANYMFLVDYQPQPDPLNSRSVTSSIYAGEMEFSVRLQGEKPLEMSWFAMPAWKQPAYLVDLPEQLQGSYSDEKMESEIVESGLTYGVYLPPGYAENTETRYRTIYIFAMPGSRQLGEIDKAVDRIFADNDPSLPPAIVVFPLIQPTPDGQKAFVEEMIPEIDKKYRTIASREGRTTVGFGFTSGAALSLATRHHDLFCGAAAYSPMLFAAERAMIESTFEKLEQPMEYYVDWGRFDLFNPDENWDIRDMSSSFFELCEKTEQASVRGGMVNDSTDWASWRNRYKEFLKVGVK